MFSKWIDEPEREDWLKDFDNNEVVPVREWLATLLVLFMPGLNIVMIFVWAFSNKEITPANKVNLARACVIFLTCVIITLAIVVGFYFLAMYIENH